MTASTIVAALAIALNRLVYTGQWARAISQALDSLARQPEAEKSITRTLFIGLAMIESLDLYAGGCADHSVPQSITRIPAEIIRVVMTFDTTTFVLEISQLSGIDVGC